MFSLVMLMCQVCRIVQEWQHADLASADSAMALAFQERLLLLAAPRLGLALEVPLPLLFACRSAAAQLAT